MDSSSKLLAILFNPPEEESLEEIFGETPVLEFEQEPSRECSYIEESRLIH